jgi:hypothetical protein
MRRLMGWALLSLTLASGAAVAQDEYNPGYDDNPAMDQQTDQAPPDASQDVNFGVFYDALSPYGRWVHTADYGYVWQPNNVEAGWRPYTQGRWAWTAYGWTWVPDESWGWAPYHYGRWVDLDDAGWSWVPDYTWGPAWVSFRYGPSYVGWTPLPPGCGYRDEWRDRDDYRRWNFVDYDAFSDERNLERRVIDPDVVHARVWVNTQPAIPTTIGSGMFYGPSARYVGERIGRPVVQVALHTATRIGEGRAFNGRDLTVVAPSFRGVAHPFGGVNRVIAGNETIGIGHLANARGNPALKARPPAGRPVGLGLPPVGRPAPRPVPPVRQAPPVRQPPPSGFSQPRPPTTGYLQPRPQPIYAQPRVQPNFAQARPQTAYAQPRVQSSFLQARPQPVYAQPRVQPNFAQARPQAAYAQPRVQPSFSQPRPAPQFHPAPAPQHASFQARASAPASAPRLAPPARAVRR